MLAATISIDAGVKADIRAVIVSNDALGSIVEELSQGRGNLIVVVRQLRDPLDGSQSDSWDCWPIPGRALHAELSSNLSGSLGRRWGGRRRWRCRWRGRGGLGGRGRLGFVCQMAGQSFQQLHLSLEPLQFLAIAV